MSARADGTPWLSVLMPIYNGASTLQATLDSVVDQAEGIEFILVDQGSTDSSVDIASRYSDSMNIRLVSAPENKNWVQNTNQALGLARASRAALLHQDDLWRPGRAALFRSMFETQPQAALWVCGADYVDHTGRCIGALLPPFGARARSFDGKAVLTKLIVQNTIALPSAAFPVTLAREIGGLDERLWYTADWNLWLDLASRGDVSWDPDRTVAFRLHSQSQTLSGSHDLNSFREQLAIPVSRHRESLPAHAEDRAIRMAEVSNLLNVWLASLYHGTRQPPWPVLSRFLALGPFCWHSFILHSRIAARVIPRLRLLAQR